MRAGDGIKRAVILFKAHCRLHQRDSDKTPVWAEACLLRWVAGFKKLGLCTSGSEERTLLKVR